MTAGAGCAVKALEVAVIAGQTVKAVGVVQGLEAALWRVLTGQWLDLGTTIPATVLDWLVHTTPPPTHAGVDTAWPTTQPH